MAVLLTGSNVVTVEDTNWSRGTIVQIGTTTVSPSTTISGYSNCTFDDTTGYYAISSSTNPSASSAYSNDTTVYMSVSSDKHTLTFKKVTDVNTTTSSHWSAGSYQFYNSYTDVEFITAYPGYMNEPTFNSSTGEWEGDGSYVNYNPWEGEYQSFTCYQIGSHSCTRLEYNYPNRSEYATITEYRAEATQNSSTTTTYTVTTYQQTAVQN